MKNIIFLTLQDVLEIHSDQILNHGGSLGVRDQHLLESAIAQPQASFGGKFLHPDLNSMASTYIFHLALNHPFIDGNKRTALVSGLTFLYLNGYELKSGLDKIQKNGQTILEQALLDVILKKNSKEHFSLWIKKHLSKIK